MPEVPATAPRWLLLVHQLPPRPSNLRVHVWRRLQQVGAVALRNSIYVLPDTSEGREDFDWIRTEIASRRGQVSVLAADAIDGYTDDELRRSFRDARSADYEALIQQVDAIVRTLARKKRPSRAVVQRGLARARERFHAVQAADFFASPRAGDAQAALARLESALVVNQPARGVPSDRLEPRSFRRREWLTRPRPGIDRMASAWLIRRFIAADAKFVFGSRAAVNTQIPFDMPDVDFGHHGSDCTYETLIRRFAITDVAAIRVGHVVHDLDLKESRYGLPDTATIGRLVEGLRDAGTSDHDILDGGIRMIEALYRSFANERAGGTGKAGGASRAGKAGRAGRRMAK